MVPDEKIDLNVQPHDLNGSMIFLSFPTNLIFLALKSGMLGMVKTVVHYLIYI